MLIKGADDGYEFFGGTVSMTNAISYGNFDDALTGKMDGKDKTTQIGMFTKLEKEISEWKLKLVLTTIIIGQ